jgi:hypothetical protein
VPRRHKPRHDADAHGAEPDETDIHLIHLTYCLAMMTLNEREGQRRRVGKIA